MSDTIHTHPLLAQVQVTDAAHAGKHAATPHRATCRSSQGVQQQFLQSLQVRAKVRLRLLRLRLLLLMVPQGLESLLPQRHCRGTGRQGDKGGAERGMKRGQAEREREGGGEGHRRKRERLGR